MGAHAFACVDQRTTLGDILKNIVHLFKTVFLIGLELSN